MDETAPGVIIIGAGPTGLSLALLLARAGIRSILVERHALPQAHPAACILATRTMEIFREIGIADEILARGQDTLERASITWVTSLAGRELGRTSALPDNLDTILSLSPVHTTHFPQNRLEPILWERVRRHPLVTFLPDTTCVAVAGEGTGVSAVLRSGAGGERRIAGTYLVACDGAGSTVRKEAGFGGKGGVLLDMIGISFKADLGALVNHRKSILYWTLNPRAFGVLIAHWLPDEWVLFVPFFPPQQAVTAFAPDTCRSLVAAAVGFLPGDLAIELVRPWTLATWLADRYRQGNIFLAGDAAHSFPPTGGLGLNTGVQDAHNIAWKLASVLRDRAGPALLDTYETERRPIGQASLDQNVRNFRKMSDLTREAGLDLRHLERLRGLQNARWFRGLPEAWQKRAVATIVRVALGRLAVFGAEGRSGERARAAFTEAIPGQAPHYRFLGLDLGVTYPDGAFVREASPKHEAADPVADYRPSTWPSARLPHFAVLRNGAPISIHDVLMPVGLTLLTDQRGATLWSAAAAALAEPFHAELRCFSIGSIGDADLIDSANAWPTLSEVGPGGAVLVRPDGHVAWRSGRANASAANLETALRRILSIPRFLP